MLEALFGQIKGVFGKSFVFAGLLPSVLVFLGWEWFRQGTSGLNSLWVELLKKPEEAGSVLSTVAAALGVALCFFASRSLFLYLFEKAPGRVLAPLRYYLIRRQLRRRLRASRQLHRELFRYTVLRWNEDEFRKPETVPDGLQLHRQPLKLSEKARERVEALARKREQLPTYRDVRTIMKGMCNLYQLAKDEYDADDCKREIQSWRDQLNDIASAELLRTMSADAYRRVVEAENKERSFPTQRQWIHPTELGNRLAALDDYAQDRYKIDTSTIWTRLLGIISADERSEVGDAQLSVEVLINLTVALLALGVIDGATLVPAVYNSVTSMSFHPNWRSAAFVIGPVILARLTYRSGVYAVGALSEKVIRLVDLYSNALLTKLGLKPPETVREELAMFGELRAFFTEGKSLPLERRLARASESDGNKK